jgi:diguanylate cyclase (GGDEF)-like protein
VDAPADVPFSEPKMSGTRAALSRMSPVDSVLLEYLNKPTVPEFPAVKPAVQPMPTLPSPPDETDYEDDRPTGRCDAPPSNPLDHVRDRGVLVRLDGEASGNVVSLPRHAIIVGRSARAEIHVADPSVSREHARIVYEYGSYHVEDMSSRNGTLLAGRVVTRAELRDGDLLQFGHRIAFRFGLMDQAQERVMQRLYDSSMRDPLTGADNRRHLDTRLASEIAFAERHMRPLSVILVDIDFFKNVNDRYGHPVGDEVLREVAAAIRGALRTEDAFARYGGEEFAIVLRDTSLLESGVVAERVRERIARTPMEVDGHSLNVTVSAGCASLECCLGTTVEELVGLAERRLYRAKRSGRNRVVCREET